MASFRVIRQIAIANVDAGGGRVSIVKVSLNTGDDSAKRRLFDRRQLMANLYIN